MKDILVSVVIPTYNRAYCIERAIQSVLAQTYTNLEIIVVDDGSTDKTKDVVNNIDDARIVYYKTNNKGAAAARNFGVSKAHGDFIAFQDSDDFWYETKIELQIEVALKKKFDLVFTKFRIVGENQIIIPEENAFFVDENEHGIADFIVESNKIGCPTILVKKDVFESVGGFDENLTTLEDWDFALKISLAYDIGYISSVLVDAYSNDNGVNAISGEKKVEAEICILKRYWNYFKKKTLFHGVLDSIYANISKMEYNLKKYYIQELLNVLYGNKTIISIVVPVCNVEKYLSACLDSIISQPIDNMEIICINDGSTDKSLSILRDYQSKDKRIVVIDKINTGYGDSMNCGIMKASGEYIGFVESDDFLCEGILAELCYHAKKHELDVIKGNFNLFSTNQQECEKFSLFENVSQFEELSLLPIEIREKLFSIAPSLWSAIYKRQFLYDNNIKFLNTPGASYQDTSFAFKIWACAERVMIVHAPIINYRQDNMSSSSNETKKVFQICAEFKELDKFIVGRNESFLGPVLTRARYASYNWNAERLSPANKIKFWLRARKEFEDASYKGWFVKRFWSDYDWTRINRIVFDFHAFCREIVSNSKKDIQYYHLLNYASPIYIYGAGMRAKKIDDYFISKGISITGFIVSEKKQDNEYMGKPIYSLSETNSDGLIIIGVSDKYVPEIIDNLERNNYYNYIFQDDLVFEVL